MMARMLFLLLACFSFTGMINAEIAPSIKVLILHDKESADVEVKGKYKIFDPNTNVQLINMRLVGKNKPVEAMAAGLKWGEDFPRCFPDQHRSSRHGHSNLGEWRIISRIPSSV